MNYISDLALRNSCGVYKITNMVTGKIYIGSAIRFMERCRKHANLLRRGKHYNRHLKNSFELYGMNSFTFEVLETTDLSNRKQREQQLILLYKSCDDSIGYNLKCETGTEAVYSEGTLELFSRNGKIGGSMAKARFADLEYKEWFTDRMRSIPKSESHIAQIKENGLKYNKNSMVVKSVMELQILISDYVLGMSLVKLSEKYGHSKSAISRIFQSPTPPLYKELLVKIGFDGTSIKDLRKPEIQANLILTQDY